MILHVLNDLHFEFAPFTPLLVEADVVVLAGDTSPGHPGVRWARMRFLASLCSTSWATMSFTGMTSPA